MSQEIKDFITGLRAHMTEASNPTAQQEAILDEILTEYEAMPGPIREIAWAVLVERGYLGVANQSATGLLLHVVPVS